MRRKIIPVIVIICLVSVLILPAASAADTVLFTGINDSVLPLNAQTMPRYFEGLLYLPYTFFSSKELGVYYAASGNQNTILLYSSGSRRLTFDVIRYTIFDQDGTQYYLSARAANGTVYLPAEFVCTFFGLTLSIIPSDPAPIVRVKNASAVLNDKTFAGIYKGTLQSYYNAYYSSSSPDTSASPSVSSDVAPTYEKVTVFLSFYAFSPKNFRAVLDALDQVGYKCCFFVSADEIAGNGDLLRRAAGSGHTIGIWLKDGTYAEYQKASALLFEAAKVKTILVSADSSHIKAAQELSDSKDLLVWSAARIYNEATKITFSGVTGKLSVTDGSRERLCFACTDKTASIMHMFLSYLTQNKYTVRRLNETNVPLGAIN